MIHFETQVHTYVETELDRQVEEVLKYIIIFF